MTTNLKKCPFCGRNAFTQIVLDQWREDTVQIGCESVDCKGSLYNGRYYGKNAMKEAIKAWNTRVGWLH